MKPADIKKVKITDSFWGRLQELVRSEMIPYQWKALNDEIDSAAKSYCIHNFRAAARLNEKRRELGEDFKQAKFSDPGFEVWPCDGEQPQPDKFYGFLFQDTDLYKWIEAAAYSLATRPDPGLEATVDEAVKLIASAQHPCGYLDTYYLLCGMDAAFTNLQSNHELYCLGHLIEAACAYYEAAGKDGLLTVARRYADYVYERMGPEGDIPGYPGHEIAEMALARLYNVTGEKKYLELAKLFIDRRGQSPNYFDEERRAEARRLGRQYRQSPDLNRYAYHQAHMPVREQKEAVGHAVRAVYLYSGMADVGALTDDETLKKACVELWRSITREKMYITGGIGGTCVGEAFSYPFDLPNDSAYAETCAAVGLVFFARRMLEISPCGEYADVMEQALYNCVLSGMSQDGKSFFYVNPLETVPEACRKDSRLGHVKSRRQKWFGCACCPPNLARLIESVASYAITEDKNTVWLNLFMGCEFTKEVDGVSLKLSVETDMPFDGGVKLKITAPSAAYASFAIRIPHWTDKDLIEISLPDGKIQKEKDGYLYISGIWEGEEEIRLSLPMPVRIMTADKRVRECLGKAAVMRGPLVYCAEGEELALYRLNTEKKISPEQGEICGNPITLLNAGFKKLSSNSAGLYTEYRKPEETEENLRLIPYFAWNNSGEKEMRVWFRV